MKKFAYKITILILPLMAAIFLISSKDKLGAFLVNPNIIRVNTAPEYDSLDILFTGSSYTYSGIIPAVFDSAGLKTYNLGISTAGPHFNELVVTDYLKEITKAPKLIVFDISLLSFTSKSDNWGSYPIHRYLNTPLTNEELLFRFGVKDQYFSMVQRSMNKGLENILSQMTGSAIASVSGSRGSDEISTSVLSEKGFEKICSVIDSSKVLREKHIFEGFRKEDFNIGKAMQFRRFVKELQNKGIQVCVISIPTNRLASFFSNEYLKEHNEFMQELVIDCNLRYYILGEKNKLNPEDYRNYDHVNCYGAYKVSTELLEHIRKDFFIN